MAQNGRSRPYRKDLQLVTRMSAMLSPASRLTDEALADLLFDWFRHDTVQEQRLPMPRAPGASPASSHYNVVVLPGHCRPTPVCGVGSRLRDDELRNPDPLAGQRRHARPAKIVECGARRLIAFTPFPLTELCHDNRTTTP